jgi:hypothetical protein
MRPSAWNGAGSSWPNTMPAMMQSATHRVK